MKDADLPWVEKYRPKKLGEVVGQKHVVNRLKYMVEAIQNGDRNMPHLLFVGDAGVGKTTCAEALARDAFGDEWRNNWIELNASDERGIDVVRTKIKKFATSARLPHSKLGKVFNLIFLDEADMLTTEAQAALRRPMEQYATTCRFILSVNNSNRVLAPIQNRCQVFRFHQLQLNEISEALITIEKGEGIDITPQARSLIATHSEGSMRKALNLLYTLSLQPTKIDEKDVNTIIDFVDFAQIELLLKEAGKGNLDKAFAIVDDMYWKGYTAQDILYKTFEMVRHSDKLPRNSKIALIKRMGETEYYIISGSNPLFQLKCFFAWIAEKSNAQNHKSKSA
jgi:replication factor C small subunit